MKLQLPSPLHKLAISSDYETFIKRDDLIHPELSGNKYRKLKGFLEGSDVRKVITMGGAFSNHVHATAAFCNYHGLECEVFIRGLDADPGNPTLKDVQNWGCKISFLSRNDYQKYRSDPESQFKSDDPEEIFIPEGGWGERGMSGLQTLAKELDAQLGDYDYLILPVGTATTLIGLARHMRINTTIIGVRAVKDNSLDERIQANAAHSNAKIQLLKGYEWGGFARYGPDLLKFMDDTLEKYGLPLDFIYNAKAFYALENLMEQNFFKKGSRIVYIHTGGLQGNRGLTYQANKQ